jgi:folylpolyglutamate synthase
LQVLETNPLLSGVRILPDADFQRGNASLAIALASTVLKNLDPSFSQLSEQLPKTFVDGLEQVKWRSRCETKACDGVYWYLDGAHTADSIKVATKWNVDECSKRYIAHALSHSVVI